MDKRGRRPGERSSARPLRVEARDPDGLVGIVTAPFLHAGLGHVAANTVPFLALGVFIALAGALRVVLVTVIVALVGGLGTWLLAPASSLHVGASGVVFGYAGYLLSSGFLSRRLRDFMLAAVIALFWGGALLGGLLPAPRRSGRDREIATCGRSLPIAIRSHGRRAYAPSRRAKFGSPSPPHK